MRSRRAGLNAQPSPKISSSGWKVMAVPRLREGPTCSRGPVGLPREKPCLHSKPLDQTRTSIISDRALTTDAPTPCRPPEVW